VTIAAESGEALRDCPGYLRLWTAATVSGFGSYVTNLAIGVLIVLNLHGGSTEVGLVNAARWFPYMLFGLVAGVLVDRARRRPFLVVTDLGRGILLLVVPVLAMTHQLNVAWLMALMATFGLMSLVNDAAFQAFVPRLVPPKLLTPAHARLDQSDAVAQTSGPVLAGGLISLLGAPAAVLVDAVSYLVSGLLLLSVTVTEPASHPMSARGVRGEAAQGLRWVYHHATLRALALTTHAWFLCSAVTGAVLVPFALRTLGLSPFGLGLALAAAGVGGLLGSLAAVRLGMRFGAGRVVIASRVATALAWALAAMSTDSLAGWLFFGAGQFLLGLSMGAENANEMGYRQTVTPDRLQGRMNATMRSINRSMIVIGAPLGGFLGDRIGYSNMLWIAALGFLAGATTLGLSRFRGARLDDAYVNPV
jgi:MFS family permease